MLAPAIVMRAVEAAPAEFDARFSATGRTYRYTVLNRDVPDPFLRSPEYVRGMSKIVKYSGSVQDI